MRHTEELIERLNELIAQISMAKQDGNYALAYSLDDEKIQVLNWLDHLTSTAFEPLQGDDDEITDEDIEYTMRYTREKYGVDVCLMDKPEDCCINEFDNKLLAYKLKYGISDQC